MKNQQMHEITKMAFMDAYYGDKILSETLKQHMEECPQCAEYWKSLTSINNKLADLEKSFCIETDARVIGRAFKTVEGMRQKNRDLRDFAVFLCLAVTLLMGIGWLALTGYGSYVIGFQMLMLLVVPVCIPVIIWRRLSKEV